jgi:plastocyanin
VRTVNKPPGRFGRSRIGLSLTVALASSIALLAGPGSASASEELLGSATYPDMTTYKCRTDAIPIYPGQNLNEFDSTTTCPHAKKLRGPGGTGVFNPSSASQGYITRFRPSMVEIKRSGKRVTPSVWDLHLHHVVWLGPNGPTFAAGEEKSIPKLPQGYGLKVRGGANWGLNHMIHSLNARDGRKVQITWIIDWVPEVPGRTDIAAAEVQWLDVAGLPQIYPVFDAERAFDANGDGNFVFPDEVPPDPSAPGYEERSKISPTRRWTVPDGGTTLVFGVGHLHPGGLSVDLEVARDGPDAGSVDGDDPSEVRPLFRSDARYYEPAGAVSWDVSMKATRPDWRISLEAGDTVSISTTYDVRKASWYESMGILPLAVSDADDPIAKDPFDDEAAVREMYDRGGILTHGRLPENVDRHARKYLGLSDPSDLPAGRLVPDSGIRISSFDYALGGYVASRGFPARSMRPPVIRPGQSVTFINRDALASMADEEQAWHTITSCKPPCNRGSGIGYPLAGGPVDFDSGQLGYGDGFSTEVTTGSNRYTTPPLTEPGTYTYFCRIHPSMRGSVRVKAKN